MIEVASIDTPEHYALFEQYINGRHADGDMYPPQLKSYQDFLCIGHSSTRYYQFMLAGKLAGIAVSDDLDQGLSAVYSFYDVSLEKRSLGTYMILWQIEALKKIPKAYLYLGYWIKNSPKMNYKSAFRPLQLYINQQWTTLL